MTRKLSIALACGALALAPGCGGDDEPDNAITPTTPTATETAPDARTTTVPEAAPQPTAPAEPPAPPPADEGDGFGGAPAPPRDEGDDSGGAPAPPPEAPADSPENDAPPPPDSPAERFEQYCEQNPTACG